MSEYSSQAKTEVHLYRPFVNLCNHALDRLIGLQLDTVRAASPLNYRFHLNNPTVIVADYEGSTVHVKPDIIITSAVAASDVNYQSGNKVAIPVYNEPPTRCFKMRQVLSSGEFKRRRNVLTRPLTTYNKIRQSEYECGDMELSVLYPVDESATAVDTVTDEAGEPSAKRRKIDSSEPPGTSSGTRAGPSSSTRSRGVSKDARTSRTSKTSKMKGSRGGGRQGSNSNNKTTYYAPDNSKQMIDARTQCAMYGMEMLSYALGVHHAITFLMIGET